MTTHTTKGPDGLQLTAEERTWRDELQKGIDGFSMGDNYADRLAALKALRDTAVKLHASLKDHGQEPTHHGYMIENRGVQPDDPQFYFHPHPIEDLIKFTHDPHANDDPEDQTVGHTFELRVFTRRWNHYDVYRIERTSTGWYLKTDLYGGLCDKTCAPMLYKALRHDSVSYPSDMGEWFAWLWQQAKAKGLGHDEVQQGVNDIAAWIRVTEQQTPTSSGIWEGLA